MNQSKGCPRNVRLSSEFKSSHALKCEKCPRLSAQKSLPIVSLANLKLETNCKSQSKYLSVTIFLAKTTPLDRRRLGEKTIPAGSALSRRD